MFNIRRRQNYLSGPGPSSANTACIAWTWGKARASTEIDHKKKQQNKERCLHNSVCWNMRSSESLKVHGKFGLDIECDWFEQKRHTFEIVRKKKQLTNFLQRIRKSPPQFLRQGSALCIGDAGRKRFIKNVKIISCLMPFLMVSKTTEGKVWKEDWKASNKIKDKTAFVIKQLE